MNKGVKLMSRSSGVPFEPQGVYLLVQVPLEVYEEGNIVLNEPQKLAKRKEYAERGDKMLVAAVGSDCRFARVGDKVAINVRGSQILNLDDIDEPFFLVRESEVLGRFE